MEQSVTGAIRNLAGTAVCRCAAEGHAIARESDALDLIGEVHSAARGTAVIPAAPLPPA